MRRGSADSQASAAHQMPRPEAALPGPLVRRIASSLPRPPGPWLYRGRKLQAPGARPSAAQDCPHLPLEALGVGGIGRTPQAPTLSPTGTGSSALCAHRACAETGVPPCPAPSCPVSHQSPLKKARLRISCTTPQSSFVEAQGSTFCHNKRTLASNQD